LYYQESSEDTLDRLDWSSIMEIYHDILTSMGWELDWSSAPISQYSNRKCYIQVCEMEDGYHEFSMCPKKHFDKWANSRHIKWRLMVENYNEEKGYGWTAEDVEKDFRQKVKDAVWFCRKIKPRMFNQFITVEM
jgi:hypothetical protein